MAIVFSSDGRCTLVGRYITHADLSLQSLQEEGAASPGGFDEMASVKVAVVAPTILAGSNTLLHLCVESVTNVALEHRGAEAVGETPMPLAEGSELSADKGSATYSISSHCTLSY